MLDSSWQLQTWGRRVNTDLYHTDRWYRSEETGRLPITAAGRRGSDKLCKEMPTGNEFCIRNFLHNIKLSPGEAEMRLHSNQQHVYRQHVSTRATYNRQRATSESALRKHASPVANPKVYFSVINGQIRNSAQRAMQLLQSSYSGVINQSSCNT